MNRNQNRGIPPNCRELTAADGYDVVDHSNVTLRLNNRKHDPAITGMANAIREAFASDRAEKASSPYGASKLGSTNLETDTANTG